MKIFFLAMLCLGFAGCKTNEASHLPALWQLPGAAVGSVFENVPYKARRKKVERFTGAHYNQIADDIHAGGGGALTQVLNLAHVPVSRRAELVRIILNDPHIYFGGSHVQNTERLVVAFMVHGN